MPERLQHFCHTDLCWEVLRAVAFNSPEGTWEDLGLLSAWANTSVGAPHFRAQTALHLAHANLAGLHAVVVVWQRRGACGLVGVKGSAALENHQGDPATPPWGSMS